MKHLIIFCLGLMIGDGGLWAQGPTPVKVDSKLISLESEVWWPLTPLEEQPNCKHLRSRYAAAFADLTQLQKAYRNASLSEASVENLTDYLLYENQVTVSQLASQRYFRIQQAIDLAAQGLVTESVELILFQNARLTDAFEYQRFFSAPAQLKRDGNRLLLKVELDALDLCQSGYVTLTLFNQCEFEEDLPTGCAEHKSCPERRVVNANSCKRSWNFRIALTKVAAALGYRESSLQRGRR